jgi:phosphate transport system permease protein
MPEAMQMEEKINYQNVVPVKSLSQAKRLRRSFRHIKVENAFKVTLVGMGIFMVVLVFGILLTLIAGSSQSIRTFGIGFLWGKNWDAVNDVYGAWPFMLGTLLTSFLALFISIPFSIAVAIFLGEYFPKGWLSELLKNTIELIAAVPSVIYGLWGFLVLVPLVSAIEVKLGIQPQQGWGIFAASLILAVMIVPYAASLGRSVIQMVPSELKEAAYALGATRWEVIRSVIIPYTKSGLFAGILLSLGRALGETMAVTMLIGNSNDLPKNIFSTGNTMASAIALFFGEANDIRRSSLIELGLVLFLITMVINMLGRKVINRFTN